MIVECKQCGRPVWAERSTKKYCTNACKQKAKRGVAFEWWYAIYDDSQEIKDHDWLTIISDEQPKVFGMLQRMRDKYGRNAMLAALHILQQHKD